MKKAAFALYIASVLLLSGLIDANAATPSETIVTQYQRPVQVTSVTANDTGTVLTVSGKLPSRCYGLPAAILLQSGMELNTMDLQLSSTVPFQNCDARMVEFTSEINLVTLVRTSRVAISENQVYMIRFNGIDFEVRVPGSDLM